MGDFRFSFKATFEMGNVKDKCDMWLDWSPDNEVHPIDRRVIEWLRTNFERGVRDIRDSIYMAERATRDNQREEEDRILAQAEEIRKKRQSEQISEDSPNRE